MQFAGFENLFILALSALALNGACRKLSAIEASWLCVCTIFIFIAVAFGTNLGTIYRIKGTVIPFLAYFAACGLPALLKKVRFPSPQLH